MKIHGGSFELEGIDGMSFSSTGVTCMDQQKTMVFIPFEVLIRLYDTAKFVTEKRGANWEEFTSSFFVKHQD